MSPVSFRSGETGNGRGGINDDARDVRNARLVAVVRRDSIDGRMSAANDTLETRSPKAEEWILGRSWLIRGRSLDCFSAPAASPSTATELMGRMGKVKAEERFPELLEMAILLRIAAVAPAAVIDLQSDEMVDMRLSTASEKRLRFSLPLARLILM